MATGSNEKLYKTVVIEVRPRLQSVNVFIKLNISSEADLKVVLNEDNFQIIAGEATAIIDCKDVKIMTKSLSSFKREDNSVSFRFSTNNSLDDLGSFKTELLKNDCTKNEFLDSKQFLTKDTIYAIQCINCGKNFNDSVSFSRVLPLPSEGSDPSDWFCHNHSHNNQNPVSLDPCLTDAFYSHCYVHLNKTVVNNIRTNDKLIVCKYCLSWLGLPLPNALKLWFNTVQFQNRGTCYKSSSLVDVFVTINDLIRNSFFSSVKLMLSCQSTSTQTDNILIWIIEKKLQILFNDCESQRKYNVAKVLFRFVENSDNAVVEQWQNDPAVNVCQISKPMIMEVLKHLHTFNKVFPTAFSASNDFIVSYIFMYESFLQ